MRAYFNLSELPKTVFRNGEKYSECAQNHWLCGDCGDVFHDDENTVGFQHNGVLRFDVPIGMDITDSEYFFRYMFLPSYKMNGNNITEISHVIDNLRGRGDKFAFIHDENIHLFGKFIEDGGCFYSNNGYKSYDKYDYYDSYYESNENNAVARTTPVSVSYKGCAYMCQNCKTYDCMNCNLYD